jgi:hypothetical protein
MSTPSSLNRDSRLYDLRRKYSLLNNKHDTPAITQNASEIFDKSLKFENTIDDSDIERLNSF